MKLKEFDYNLPKELIAIEPAFPRDSSKLFVHGRLNTKSVHTKFNKLIEFLKYGDVLVLNNTQVIPARLIAKRIDRAGHLGRKFKILLLEKKTSSISPLQRVRGSEVWQVLIDGKGKEIGLKLYFNKELQGEIIEKLEDGIWNIKFNKSRKKLKDNIFKIGQMPLPPYIKQEKYKKQNKDWYQTVYAKHLGSVAAPTAGLHFTKDLFKKIKKKGIEIEYVTLHIGIGTFMPVKTENITDHKMHSEFATIAKSTSEKLNKAKKEGRRVIAVGTTSVRALEAFSKRYGKKYVLGSGSKDVNIFIYPPYKFRFVDGMVTNFHLPKSTLLMMVAAFLSQGDRKGIKKIKKLYQKAIEKKYRFYSYGDSMLIV